MPTPASPDPRSFLVDEHQRAFGDLEDLRWKPVDEVGPEHLVAAAYEQHLVVLRLKRLLLQAGLNQQEFADRCELSHETLARKLRGESKLQYGDAQLWGTALQENLTRQGENLLPADLI